MFSLTVSNLGLPNGTPTNARDIRDANSIPRSRRSPGEGNDYPLSILVWRIPGTEESDGL